MFFYFDNVYINAVIMILVGTIALRIAGRKSISQMTISQVVIMIAIGSILVEPIKRDSVIITTISIFLFIVVLFLLEILSLKVPFFEQLIFGKSKIVIENGNVKMNNLQKLRMTKDQLDMLLRQNGISEVTDVKIATLEANGQLAYEVKEDAKTMTIADFKRLTGNFFEDYQQANEEMQRLFPSKNLFDEVKDFEEKNDENNF